VATDRARQRRALWWALALNAGYLAVEVVGGLVFGSVALLADAAHMASDTAALAVALLAQRLASRPASARHTYGLVRAEVLGAQVNGLLLLGAAGLVAWEAARRLGDPPEVAGAGVVAVAAVGLGVNLLAMVLVARAAGRSLNMRGVVLHLGSDALGSLAAIAAGVAVVLAGARWVDPVAALGIAGLVALSAVWLLRDAARVLLEGTPRGLSVAEIADALAAEDGVEAVHHLHVWDLASDTPALSAHVVLAGPLTLHEAQQRGAALKAMLEARFGIAHATLELECHACEPESRTAHGAAGPRDGPGGEALVTR
jgi:cobalt-zinc-cadmium efflux system protein